MEQHVNTKQDFNYNIDNNIESAFRLANKTYTNAELIDMLKTGSICEKQIAVLKLEYIDNEEEFTVLISNLTGCDGKIREAVALKINTLLLQYPELRTMFANKSAEIFADATIDINANICRLIIDSAYLLQNYSDFSKKYTAILILFINDALQKISSFVFRDKKYIINKQLFKLYWCLEALSVFYKYADDTNLEQLLLECAVIKEYTIREKVAKIVAASNKYTAIKRLLSNDTNYYVQQIITSS